MRRRGALALQTEGAALIEFAIVLPLLVVFLVGIYDFSGAFNQKQKIGHAAQEGAIVAGAQPMTDMDPGSATPPDSLQPVLEVIFNSLSANNVLPPGGSIGSCTVTPTHVGGLKWSYSISDCITYPLVIVIDRGWVPADPGPVTVGTRVTVSHRYIWRFNSVIQFLVPGATYAPFTDLTEMATVHNQM